MKLVIVRAASPLGFACARGCSSIDVRRTFERFVHVCTSRGHLEQGSRAARRSGKRSNLVTGHGLETSVAWASVAGPCDAAIADGGPTQSQRTQERRNGRFASGYGGHVCWHGELR